MNDTAPRLLAHAALLGDRLSADRAAESDVISTAPFCYRKGAGYVVVFRYGVAVAIGLEPLEEADVFGQLASTPPIEEERLGIEIDPGQEEGLTGAGRLRLKALTPAHVLVLADVLGKSVALARYERDIAAVFDTIEPISAGLAADGRIPRDRSGLLRIIGQALMAQHRVSGRIAFAEKPEILWDHPELERFYARLEDEYEIIERGTLLNGKVDVLGDAAQSFTDLIDTRRSNRLEVLIVLLILAELVLAAVAYFKP